MKKDTFQEIMVLASFMIMVFTLIS